ncbi:ABC transporter ATP-binding protein [Candidatus Kaiserbacteria bacterium]|nr:ABC transporter ATP-binding protein [Candidatus Kaiserbacteria bacterium]
MFLMQGAPKKLASAKTVFRAYWARVSEHKGLLATILVGGAIVQGATLVAPLYLRQFFNLLAQNTPSEAVVVALFAALTVVVAMWLVEWVGRRIQDTANMYLSSRVMTQLMTSSFNYLLGHSYNFFISNFAGSLTHRVSKFGRSFEVLFDTLVISFIPTFVFVCGAIVVLFLRHHTLGLALLAWTICFLAFQIYVAKLRQPARAYRAEADTRVTGALADAISNQSTIALFSGKMFESGLFNGVVEVWRKATLKSWWADAFIWSGIGLFIIVIEAGLFFGAVKLWQQGLASVGDFVLIQTYLMTVFDRLVGINRELRRFFDAYADSAEMVYILELPHAIKDKKGAKTLQVKTGEIWFDDMTFSFGDGTPVLHNFNLTIKGGERVALVGPSGAGKTTVTKLLLRLYDVQKGGIKIDGVNISGVTQDSLRENIAFVPQEPILFHRTLMENIRYGRRDASDAEVIEAARLAHCHGFISKLPEQYNTYVGERGVKLSGGERQRVAIARAILKNAPILVLDEATSSLDSESEALIQDALETLMKGKTVVVIAHRLSTIMKMDRIIVVEGGSIVAQGTHLELVNQEGLYRKLWSIQAGGFLGDGHAPKFEDILDTPDEEDGLEPEEEGK